MNVYEIGIYFIAARNANEAFIHYLKDTDFVKEVDFEDLKEGAESLLTVKIRRLHAVEITERDFMCHEEQERQSLREMINLAKEFPCTLARYI